IAAIDVVIIHFQSMGLVNFGFSARYIAPSGLSLASMTPPPLTYAPLTRPLRSKERTHLENM
ncbi:MAG: hypothetical protein II314_06825, partial [Prevotella sp.]|nr:hypothetical protein [Prevotella sp.]